MQRKGSGRICVIKIHLNAFIWRVFSEKTGRLSQSPYGGVDHSPLWIEAITLYRPFTINFDVKNPRLLGLYTQRRGVFFRGAIAPVSVHFC